MGQSLASFLASSHPRRPRGGSLGREEIDSALLVDLRRFISLPGLFPLVPANRPWVSEDGFKRVL